jgi:hypothetical protein
MANKNVTRNASVFLNGRQFRALRMCGALQNNVATSGISRQIA